MPLELSMEAGVVLVILILTVLLFRVNARSKARYERVRREYQMRKGPITPGTMEDMILSGNKIEAIKKYREQTGSDLKTAKNAVEEIERKLTSGTATASDTSRFAYAQSPTGPTAGRVELSRENLEEIMALVRQGEKIQAIKRFREITGADLLHAKEAIEALEAHGI